MDFEVSVEVFNGASTLADGGVEKGNLGVGLVAEFSGVYVKAFNEGSMFSDVAAPKRGLGAGPFDGAMEFFDRELFDRSTRPFGGAAELSAGA